MDYPKIEQPKGLVSKIPVRQIRPPSKLPVPISSKENQPKKYPAQSKSSNIKNAVTRNQSKPTSKLLASRAKESLATQKARPVANAVKDSKTYLRRAGPKCVNAENVSSKSQPSTHKAVSASIAGESIHNSRLKNQDHLKGFSENSAKLGLQAIINGSDISVKPYKKPLNKEIFPENRRLTSAAARIQNVDLAIVKNNVVDRRLTNLCRKTHNGKSTNFKTSSVNVKFTSVDSTEIQRSDNFGIHVRKQSFQPEKFEIQNTQDKLCSSDDTFQKMFNIDLPEGEVRNEINFSSNPNESGFSNVEDAEDKENDENRFLQPDVEFEPDERYRNQILFGQGFSPDIKPKQFKSSVAGMPSFFLNSKTALKRLEKLEEDGRKESLLRMSGRKRPSQPSKCNPIQAVLRALENVDLAAEDRRVSAMKKNNPSYISPLPWSPMFKQHVDPYKTALKKIEALQMKNKAKSIRKVTFSLEPSVSNIEESQQNEKPNCKKALTFSKEEIQDEEDSVFSSKASSANPEPKETTPELHLPPDSSYRPEKLERNLPQSHYHNMLLRVCDRICSPDKKRHQSSKEHEKSNNSSNPESETYPEKGLKTLESTGAIPNKLAESETRSSLYLQRSQPIQNKRVSALTLNNRKCEPTFSSGNSKAPSTPILKLGSRISESVGPCFRTLNNILSEPAREDNRYSLYLPRRPMVEPLREDTGYSLYLPSQPHQNIGQQDPRRSTLSKLCTPRPISFFPKPGNADSISPEFLCRRTSQIVAHAPISTPMVLRTMAANLEDSLSPSRFDEVDSQVCQRLDFDDEDKSEEKPVLASIGTPFKFNKCPILGIVTNQQILDNMADEECQAISSTWLPGTLERSFYNPVAHILTHGDDMHFVPLADVEY